MSGLVQGPAPRMRPVKGPCLVCPLQLWQAALSTLNPNPTDSCPLYLNYATVAALPSRVSRHNSPSAAHFVTRLVRTCLPPGTHRCILVSARGRPAAAGEPPSPPLRSSAPRGAGHPGSRALRGGRAAPTQDAAPLLTDGDAEVRDTRPFTPDQLWRQT